MDIQVGDVVSTAQAQVDMVRAYDPVTEGLAYIVNARGRAFSYVALPGDMAADVTAGLAAELLEEQTYLAVLVDDADVFVAGPVGVEYAIATPLPANLLEVLSVQEAAPAVPPGRLRVIKVQAIYTKLRDDPGPVERVILTVRREIEGLVNIPGATQIETTAPVFQVDASTIKTILSRATTGPVPVFESVVLPE